MIYVNTNECNTQAPPIKGNWPTGRDMLERKFSDSRSVEEYVRQKVERSQRVLPENRTIYIEWAHSLLTESLSFSRVLKYVQVLMTFEKFLQKPFEAASRRDLETVVITLDHVGYRPHYLQDIKFTIRKFYKWLRKTEEYPPEVKWIRYSMGRAARRMLPNGLLSEEHIGQMITAATGLRNKAIIAVLYDSGCRIGEIRTMRIGSVAFDQYGARIQITGKTGDRSLRLTISVPFLANWINNHPKRDDPYAPLWLTQRGTPMRYQNFQGLIPKIAKAAGIKTRVHAHLLRHSRATFLASYLTESQLCARFGWIHGSEQPGTYVHLSGRDSDDAILKLYGIKKDSERDVKWLMHKPCAKCGVSNAFNNVVCVGCGIPLNKEAPVEHTSHVAHPTNVILD